MRDEGFFEGMLAGAAARRAGKTRVMVFDWQKAERLLDERGWPDAEAGLLGDWSHTGGTIVDQGRRYHGSYTYLASIRCQPALRIGHEDIPCWVWQDECDHGWGHDSKWPQTPRTDADVASDPRS